MPECLTRSHTPLPSTLGAGWRVQHRGQLRVQWVPRCGQHEDGPASSLSWTAPAAAGPVSGQGYLGKEMTSSHSFDTI